jgi:acrylyl-CoA reductase (NADPH)
MPTCDLSLTNCMMLIIQTVKGLLEGRAAFAAGEKVLVTACGLAQGADLAQTVLPSIWRNVTLAEIDSVNAPQSVRAAAWSRLARELDLKKLERTITTIGLADVPGVAGGMFAGKVQGRTVVDVNA